MDEPQAATARKKRIYTCTPVSFSTDAPFFARDTGLIHTVLKSLGVESRCILALPHTERDLPDPGGRVIRATLQEMKSPQWWRSLDIDGVYLYSWGAMRYNGIARAIRKAGLTMAVHLDMGATPRFWLGHLPLPRRLVVAAKRLVVDIFRARHLGYADFITAPRNALEGLAARRRYRPCAARFHPWPCPVAPHFRYDGTEKQERVVCIGRWNDEGQKRPQYLMKALERLASLRPHAEAEIYGTLTPPMKEWHAALPPSARSRIHLKGFLDSALLPAAHNAAQVVFCPSDYEGTCIAVAEALCCGCSAVVSNRPVSMEAIMGYASQPGCGRLPDEDTPESMAEALAAELESWERGEREAHAIAGLNIPLFHCEAHLREMFAIPEAGQL